MNNFSLRKKKTENVKNQVGLMKEFSNGAKREFSSLFCFKVKIDSFRFQRVNSFREFGCPFLCLSVVAEWDVISVGQTTVILGYNISGRGRVFLIPRVWGPILGWFIWLVSSTQTRNWENIKRTILRKCLTETNIVQILGTKHATG